MTEQEFRPKVTINQKGEVQAEVFSMTEVIPKQVSDRVVVDRRLGLKVNEKADQLRRRNILNREFSGSVRRDA